jgi:NADH:ubiquinone oxidoreductase subunit 5 (subunit L)/multisubunit Na+/H+ antiporter MnhA subunit
MNWSRFLGFHERSLRRIVLRLIPNWESPRNQRYTVRIFWNCQNFSGMMRLRLGLHVASHEEFEIMDTSILLVIVSLPLFGALAILLVPRKYSQGLGLIALTVSVAAFILIIRLWPQVENSMIHIQNYGEVPGLHLSLAMRADRLGIFFSALITLIGAAIAQYARYYFKGESVRRFWFLFMVFQGSMLGIALSESLLLLFIFWEMTTVSSALLIAHHFNQSSARTAATLAFMITGAGGLCLLAGAVLLAQLSGTDQFSKLAQDSAGILSHEHHRVALVLILLGAFSKSAQFPFHFWLPGAMAAPIPISAYLHSATMVKAGIILMARMFPAFSASDIWQPVLSTVGLVTFVVGSWNAFRSVDMKKMLAHSTVAYLGVLTAIYGYSTGGQVKGELLHIANHAFYKSSLFLMLGWFEKVTGTRDIDLLDREIWYRRQPLGALLFCIAGLSIVGGPLLLSYTAKDLFFDVVFTRNREMWPALLVMVGSILSVAYSIKLVVATFWGEEEPGDKRAVPDQKVPAWLLIIPALLITPQLIGGLALNLWEAGFKEPAHEWSGGFAFWAALDVKATVKISIFAGGIGLYFLWRRLERIALMDGFLPLSLSLAQRFLKMAGRFSYGLQGSSYQSHMSIILIATLVLTSTLFILDTDYPQMITAGFGWEQTPFFIFPAMLVLCSSLALPFAQDRVLLLILLGLGTFGVALFYVLMRAPDLALTQLLVDTLGLIVLLVVFHHLRGQDEEDARPKRFLRASVAVLMGLATGALVLLAGIQAAGERVGMEQLNLALPLAHGRNVVNVILVDMRALDTMGEVLVLVLAALGVAALLQRRRCDSEDPGRDGRSS